MPQLLFDLSEFDLDQVQFDADEVEKVNPHRGQMRMLDGVIWAADDWSKGISFKQIRDDEFWVPGHIPGRPLFPGVLMLEAAAQTASFLTLKRMGQNFLGFIAADDVKFRGQVVPGDRLILLGHQLEYRRRRSICAAQGVVNGTIVFEATITGMPF